MEEGEEGDRSSALAFAPGLALQSHPAPREMGAGWSGRRACGLGRERGVCAPRAGGGVGGGRGGLPATVAVARLSSRSVGSAAWGMAARLRKRAGGGACPTRRARNTSSTPPTRGGVEEARVTQLGRSVPQATGWAAGSNFSLSKLNFPFELE